VDKKEYNQKWRQINKEELKRKKHEYYENNKQKWRQVYEKNKPILLKESKERYKNDLNFSDRKKRLAKKWRIDNQEIKREYDKKYKESHKEYYKNYMKSYINGEKREHLLEQKRQDYGKNKVRYNKIAKLRYLKNREARILKASDYYYKTVKPIKIEVFTHYSNGEPRCACCGETGTIEFLTIEHIHGRKNEDTRRTGHGLYRWLKSQNYPKGYEILCWNCNCSDGFYGVCSHKKQYEFPNKSEGKYKKACIKHYSKGKMTCSCCNESNVGFLAIDHIENNGSQHKRKIKKSKIFKWLSDNKFPQGYKVLCFNCNSGRNLTENKICPHKLNFK